MTDLPGDTAVSRQSTSSETEEPSAVPDAAAELRPGVPVWRVGKPDSFLAADVATARAAVQTIAAADDIGVHLGARSEGTRCVTHLFESKKAGYRGWVWFATLARVSRGKESTVNEVGLLPTEDSVLAPPWVPWSERVRPEDQQEHDDAAAEDAAARGLHEQESHAEDSEDDSAVEGLEETVRTDDADLD